MQTIFNFGIFVTNDGYIASTRGLASDEPLEPGFTWVDPYCPEDGELTCIAVLRNCNTHTAFHIHKTLLELLCLFPKDQRPDLKTLMDCGKYNYMQEDLTNK